jgi:hypothetical protein
VPIIGAISARGPGELVNQGYPSVSPASNVVDRQSRGIRDLVFAGTKSDVKSLDCLI